MLYFIKFWKKILLDKKAVHFLKYIKSLSTDLSLIYESKKLIRINFEIFICRFIAANM